MELNWIPGAIRQLQAERTERGETTQRFEYKGENLKLKYPAGQYMSACEALLDRKDTRLQVKTRVAKLWIHLKKRGHIH